MPTPNKSNGKGVEEGIPANLRRAPAQPSYEELQAEIARLKAAQQSSLKLKVSEKGCVSIYGLGRFPASFFPQQWLRILDMADEIRTFIEENRDKLSWK